MASVRSIVLGWNPCEPPTEQEYNAAKLWMNLSKGKPIVGAFDLAKIKALIRKFEANHSEIF